MHPVVVFFLALPVAAIGLVVWTARSAVMRPLLPAMSLSGAATALAAAFLAFTRSTAPIAPYESAEGAWWPLVGALMLGLYVGFGVGVALAALIGVPYHLLIARRRT